MFINKVISFQNGWQLLSENKSHLLQDIRNSLHSISKEKLISVINNQVEREIEREIKQENIIEEISIRNNIKRSFKSKSEITLLVKEKLHREYGVLDTDAGSSFSNPPGYNTKSISTFISTNWRKAIIASGWSSYTIGRNIIKSSDLRIRHLKESISIRLLTRDNGILANWIYVETQKAHQAEICDITVLLVPMSSYKINFLSNRSSYTCFEELRVQFEDLCPIQSLAPFVIIGFSEVDSEIEVFGYDNTDHNINTIEKCIEFSPEYYQAGMGILSYFGEIIKTKHPDIQAKVKIEQDGSLVRLHIETEDGTKEIIEKTLESYTRVIANQEPVETLLDNKLHIMKLQNKLDIASMEVRQTRDMLALEREVSSARLLSVEEEVLHLRLYIGNQMNLASQNSNIIEAHAATNNKIITELMGSSKMLLKDLMTGKSTNSDVLEALDIIDNKLQSDITSNDEYEIKAAIETINEKSPDIIDELGTALRNTAYGVSGNIVYQWLVTISNTVC